MTTNPQLIETLSRIIRRTDAMGATRGDGSTTSLIRSDAIQSLRFLGFAWDHYTKAPVPVREQS
tara:strand:- start:291 stop:482 length:192 start_codon:yes stop_codon:yes gene_type:complete